MEWPKHSKIPDQLGFFHNLKTWLSKRVSQCYSKVTARQKLTDKLSCLFLQSDRGAGFLCMSCSSESPGIPSSPGSNSQRYQERQYSSYHYWAGNVNTEVLHEQYRRLMIYMGDFLFFSSSSSSSSSSVSSCRTYLFFL